MVDDIFKMQAKTFYGFEELLVRELMELGAQKVEAKNRMVEFEGDKAFMYKANYSLRTALRILKPIYNFEANNEHVLYKNLFDFPWENILTIDQSFVIDATVNSEYFNHSQYAALKMKDAIVDRFKQKNGTRPSVNKENPDLRLNLHISRELVTVSLDSSGESLHKRGYRVRTGEAPISEVLAAGMLLMAGWDGKGNFLDPMCGSGTILTEAAMIAAKIPPQIQRSEFAFMKWPDYDEELFSFIKNTRLSRITEFTGNIVGYDINPEMVQIATENVINADLDDFIKVEQQDFFTSVKKHFPVLIVFNPPYNERIMSDNEVIYKQIGDTIKQHYPNTLTWLISSDLDAVKYVGLRPSRRIKLYNGPLECKFLNYETYEGSKKGKYINKETDAS